MYMGEVMWVLVNLLISKVEKTRNKKNKVNELQKRYKQ